ncbi:hypothetical protein F5B20DRAFT_577189 [Whalleya microplaca]|nr:hypothetical protein F5B20DRAFT_577189 [Whalleya microplaca]
MERRWELRVPTPLAAPHQAGPNPSIKTSAVRQFASSKSEDNSLPLRHPFPSAEALIPPPFDSSEFDRASGEGRRDAPGVLDGLEPSRINEDAIITQGLESLQAYNEQISSLPVEDARNAILRDSAETIVMRWAWDPKVRRQIEGNHPKSQPILQLIADIVVGASQTKALDTWIKYRPENLDTLRYKEMDKKMAWKGLLFMSVIRALLRWSPDGSANAALDYASDVTEEQKRVFGVAGLSGWKRPCSHIPLLYAAAIVNGIPRNRASPENYTRCQELHSFYFRLDYKMQLRAAQRLLMHSTPATVDPFIAYLVGVERNPKHIHRPNSTKGSYEESFNHAKFFRSIGHHADVLLKKEGRLDEATWVYRFIKDTWPFPKKPTTTQPPIQPDIESEV